MTPFMPRLFTACLGEVLFDGRTVPIGKVIDAREYAIRQAMNLKASPRTQAMWDAVYHSARQAIDAARNQRRNGFRLITYTGHAA